MPSKPSRTDPREFGLKSDSFTTEYPDNASPRVILNIMAKQKVGKTDFSMRYAPGPIIIYNFDQGLEGVVGDLRRPPFNKEIIVAGVPVKDPRKFPSYHFARPVVNRDEGDRGSKDEKFLERVKKAAVPIWERWIRDYREGLESKRVRTLVIDTQGGVLQLGKFAFHGMEKVTARDDPYGQKGGELKAIMQGLIADGYNYDKNVIWLSRVKDVWENNQPVPGKVESAGYKELPYEVQATLYLKSKKTSAGMDRTVTVHETRLKGLKQGDVLGGRQFRFDVVASLLTGTDMDEWE